MKMKTCLFVYLTLTLALTACGAGGTTSSAASLEGEWTLLTLNGASLLPDSTINIAFADEQVSGFSGCNRYGGTYTVKGSALDFAELAVTAMACFKEGVMGQEQAYTGALSDVAKFRLDSDRLELLDESGAVILVYARQEPFTGDPAMLVGTKWQLLTLDGSPLDETLSFTLSFAENRYSGLAGCRHFEGDYQASDGEIGFPMMTMVEETCPDADDAYWGLEGRFTDALSWARHWRIVNDQLEIRTERDEVLVFASYTSMPEVTLDGTTWTLTTFIDGETATSLLADTEITLAFEDDQATGSGGCNSYGGSYTLERGELHIGPVAITEMYCMTPEGVTEQETRYTSILADVTLFEWDADRLTLKTADGRGLVFTAQR
jgi:heat shock protein HslJ